MSVALAPGTPADLRREIVRLLSGTSGSAALDARLLIAHATGCDWNDIVLRDDRVVDDAVAAEVRALANRRAAGEPVARIVGEREFYGLMLALHPETLVPRPDTETLVDAALAVASRTRQIEVLDLGTGSGAILIAVLVALPYARGVGVDLSASATETARANARRHGVADRASFRVGDWTRDIDDRFDIVVANPPYVATNEIPGLPVDVRDHDPHVALDGGADGLGAYRKIFADLDRILVTDGVAFFEIGMGQADAVAGIADVNGFTADFGRDLAGIVRVAELRRTASVTSLG